MPKKYKYVNGNKMIVVNNYDLGTDVIPEEEQIVPDPLVTDVGKVLTVNNAGNPAWEDAPEELPALTGNAGKVLTVSSGASGVEWAEVPEELPAVTSADEGDVLTVNASGEWEAAAPSGGGGAVYITETISGNAHTLSKNYNEIMAYIEAGDIVFLKEEPEPETGTLYCPLVANAVLGGVLHAITFEYYDTSDRPMTKRFVDFSGMSATGALTYTEDA